MLTIQTNIKIVKDGLTVTLHCLHIVLNVSGFINV